MVVETFIQYVLLLIVILFLVMLSNRLKVAYPIVLVLAGLGASLLPGIPLMTVDPELIFVIFLPPLLYEAAWYTSWKDFWRWRRVITSFAFLIVLITSLVVALVSNAVIPGFSIALGFLLGGIVSPPDAVSATAILKTVKVPKRLTAILEGESLLNDASSLVVFRFALIAVGTGQFVFHEAAISFVLVIVMGIVIGVAIGLVYYAVHRWLPTDANIDVILTLTAPYVMYITAEHFKFSGVLAVVSGGLLLSSQSHVILTQSSRMRGTTVWSALGFVLNGLVFMLIGLELPEIVAQLGNVSLIGAIGYALIISAVLIVCRILSTIGSSYFTVFISRYITTADSRPGLRGPLIIGWAGMRGVVSLAAALSVPAHLESGAPFPQRNLILFITFVVILVTLVLQGLTLPMLIKKLHYEDPDHYLPTDEQDIQMGKKLSAESAKFLRREHAALMRTNKAIEQLVTKLESDTIDPKEDGSNAHADYCTVYLQVLNHQREILKEENKKPEVNEEVIRKYHGLIDMEEEKIRIRSERLG